jgi:hypothetical protein
MGGREVLKVVEVRRSEEVGSDDHGGCACAKG